MKYSIAFENAIKVNAGVLSKEEFLRIYSLPDGERQSVIAEFDNRQANAYKHLFVAYRMFLKERGELE